MENTALFSKLQHGFEHALKIPKTKGARERIEELKLDPYITKVGFCSGQTHHNKSKEFKEELFEIGFLKLTGNKDRFGNPAYSAFGRKSLMFPLENKEGDVVNFYHQTLGGKFKGYLNQKGVYPKYPSLKTTRLFITQTILDAATLLSADVIEHREAVIALKDGEMTAEIEVLIRELIYLEEIIIIH